MVRHMFAGALSPVGFIDFFDSILPPERAKARYYIKGSSGSGKSTFMKRVAADLEAAGFDVEMFHCSNDPASLDAVACAELGLCVMDATAPHSRDPFLPGGVDRIIDFAQFLDVEKVAARKHVLAELAQEKKLQNARAAGCFAALGCVVASEEAFFEAGLKRAELEALLGKWTERVAAGTAAGREGSDRKLFVSAVTPEGPVSFAGRCFAGNTVHGIVSEFGAGTAELLARLQLAANARGLDTESFRNPAAPDRHECLRVSDTVFVRLDGLIDHGLQPDSVIDMRSCIGLPARIRTQPNLPAMQGMVRETSAQMSASKAVHAEIEAIYAEAMDFKKLDALYAEIFPLQFARKGI
ncbi:MAG: hypothetical protein FWD98_02320 [Defluviitaleaceae bacterium]|nr:hypothetical protein [Defluviitaleaceae bacterium]